MICGYFAGISDAGDISHCPSCGAGIATTHGDGSATCEECNIRFAVIMIESEENDNE